MTLKEKRVEWKARYDAWKESGQSVAAWCRDQNIKVHQMYYWVNQIERGSSYADTPAANTQWLAVQVEEPFPCSGKDPILLHFGPLTVEVRPGASMSLLSDVIQVLQHQC
ncbi:IS66 family insertion sequence element accessory protein TnpA [Siminovitchia sp. 179-K 8D1 HS]|jgi:hypothetical protein|uniref:IS66 family insertion sequence element accessory protein TnpA n=1 Tax=Siminovitchia sp. 179-K 8D1 HS TaxID=3142385 RepID=UPI0039A16AB8